MLILDHKNNVQCRMKGIYGILSTMLDVYLHETFYHNNITNHYNPKKRRPLLPESLAPGGVPPIDKTRTKLRSEMFSK